MKQAHLKIVQGTPFRLLVRVEQRDEEDVLVPMPLTDCSIKLQARAYVAAHCTLLDISSDTSQIEIDEDGGTFTVQLTSVETSGLIWGSPYVASKAVFQCEIEPPNGEIIRILEGTITLSPEVVR